MRAVIIDKLLRAFRSEIAKSLLLKSAHFGKYLLDGFVIIRYDFLNFAENRTLEERDFACIKLIY